VLHLAQLVDEGITAARERLEAGQRNLQAENGAIGSDGTAPT
jgi:hypothetical protein